MLLKYLFGNILYFFSFLIPKSNKIWVFGSWGGQKFTDNPKYFHNYVRKHTNISPVWLAKNTELIRELKNKGLVAYHSYSILGIWYSSRASVGVVSHGLVDLNRYACARMNIVQTWHGIPMKPVLLSDEKPVAVRKRKMLSQIMVFFPFLKKELLFDKNLIICSSSFHVKKLLKNVFGDKAPLYNVGFPRLDGLFNFSSENLLYKDINNFKKNGYRVGIYMPTYRRKGEFDIISFMLKSKSEIEEQLLKSNSILYVKVHPYDFFKVKKAIQSETIIIIEENLINNDIYEVLNSFDFLISDYSSIVFDFLILVRPVYLLVPDRENYIFSNGKFVYDYLNIGLPVVDEWSGILSMIKDKKQIKNLDEISVRHHSNRDGNNSKRLYNKIINLLA